MKLSVIALDYDGTIARGDVLDPQVRDAIAEARTRGIFVLLVTGRILEDLRRVAGELQFVDGVVAENGAILHFPSSNHTTPLAPPVSEAFIAELGRRAIPFRAGRCLVDAEAVEGPRLLDVIRTLELPLVLLFNGGRVMVLSQGVSKATGLAAALDILRLSPRNTVAIGDAENDHELLRLAEVGVAVEWGSAALRSAADLTISGEGPPAVAEYIRTLARAGRLPVPPRARRRLRLGFTEDGHEFSLAVRGRNVLIGGDPRSGKSWIAGLLCEHLILHGYSICVIDPEGDYASLEALPGVALLGGDAPPPTPRELLRGLRYPDRSLVIDLSRRTHGEKVQYIRSLLPAIDAVRRRTGLPHRVVLDEAHYFLQDADARRLVGPDGSGYTLITYRASRLPSELLAASEVIIVTCQSDPAEISALRDCCARGEAARSEDWSVIARLRLGQAVALPVTEEAGGALRLFTIGPRLTPHVRHREKYVDVPVTEDKAFVFSVDGHGPRPVRTLREFVAVLEEVPHVRLHPYLQRRDFSRWIADVFGDHALAAELAKLEERYAAGAGGDTRHEIVGAIRSRYDLLGGVDTLAT